MVVMTLHARAEMLVMASIMFGVMVMANGSDPITLCFQREDSNKVTTTL